MNELDQISMAIGRLQAAQEAHATETRDARERICKRLDAIEAKVDPLVAYRNRMLGAVAVVATGLSLAVPWLKKAIGL